MVIIPTARAEVSEVLCIDCDLPSFQEGLTFWCPGCGDSVEVR